MPFVMIIVIREKVFHEMAFFPTFDEKLPWLKLVMRPWNDYIWPNLRRMVHATEDFNLTFVIPFAAAKRFSYFIFSPLSNMS